MTNINSVTISGNLTKDAEHRATASGTGIINFTVAVNKSKKVGDKWEDYTSFIDCFMWGDKQLENLVKGQKVVVLGELKQDRWEKDGKTASKVVVEVNRVEFGSNKSESKPVENKFQEDYDLHDDLPF